MSLEVTMKEQTKRSSPKYTLEFKQDAAKLVNEKGHTHQQAGGQLRYFIKCDRPLVEGRTKPCNRTHHQDGSLELNGAS